MNTLASLDKDNNRIVFNSDVIAKDINQIISKLRIFFDSTPIISGEYGKLVKKKTPGPTLVNTATKLLFRDNTFNYKTRRFEAKKSRNLVNRTINHQINKKIDEMELKAKNKVKEKLIEQASTTASSIISNFLEIYLQSSLKKLPISENHIKTTSNYIARLITREIISSL